MPGRKKTPPRKARARGDTLAAPKEAASLAGGIAHDFNNLLTIVRTNVAFLQQELEHHEALPYVDQLQAATHRMAQVVRQLQAFSGGTFTKPVDIRPGEIVRRLSDTLKHVLVETVEFRVSVKSSGVVSMDPSQLERAVVTLLLFVAESVRDGGRIWLTVEDRAVHAKRAPAAQFVEIRFETSAAGLKLSESQRLFQPGFRKQRGSTGADLRLASVAGMVKLAGGSIEALDATTDGYGFRVLLPIVERLPDQPPRLELARERPLEGHEVILVVEDDADVRNAVRLALERFGYSVLEAEDGTDALRLMDLLTAPPDLLLTDLVMPEVGGRELVSVLAKEGKLPRVLLMSGYTNAALESALPAADHPFIAKPFTHEELAAQVREVLDRPAESGQPPVG